MDIVASNGIPARTTFDEHINCIVSGLTVASREYFARICDQSLRHTVADGQLDIIAGLTHYHSSRLLVDGQGQRLLNWDSKLSVRYRALFVKETGNVRFTAHYLTTGV